MTSNSSLPSLALPTTLLLAFVGGDAAAEIATDGSVGPRLELEGREFAIREDLGMRAGDNLFHSFERFSLRGNESAVFHGSPAIENVISRVTGGKPSRINGTIDSTMMPNADFYFINPAGVLFGPNAVLNVPGSFHVSTADELRFEGGEVFSASDPAASSLSLAAPEAFGFLGGAAGEIRAAGSQITLINFINPDQTLSFTAGTIAVENESRVIANHLLFATQASAGEVPLAAAGPAAARSGTITFGSEAPEPGATISTSNPFGSGTVRIEAGTLRVVNALVSDVHMLPDDSTGGLDVAAERVIIRDDLPGDEVSGLLTQSFGQGRAGDIRVTAPDVAVLGGGIVSLPLLGDGGRVTVEAHNILLAGSAAAVGVIGAPSGFFPDRTSGGVAVIAHESLTIGSRGQINTGTFGDQPGGSIAINLDEGAALTMLPGSRIAATASATGPGGDIAITGGDLLIIGGEISAASTGEFTVAGAEDGRAGDVVVDARSITLRDGGQIDSSTAGSGAAGNLMISARHDLVLDRGRISTDVATVSTTPTAGGTIAISAGRLVDVNDSVITTNGVEPVPGSSILTLTAPLVAINHSDVTSLTAAGEPVPGVDAGVVLIDADSLLISSDSTVAATSSLQLTGLDEQLGSQLVSAMPVDAEAMLTEPCVARRDIGASSFTGVGRGGLPASPDQPLGSAYMSPPAAVTVRPAALTLAGPCDAF